MPTTHIFSDPQIAQLRELTSGFSCLSPATAASTIIHKLEELLTPPWWRRQRRAGSHHYLLDQVLEILSPLGIERQVLALDSRLQTLHPVSREEARGMDLVAIIDHYVLSLLPNGRVFYCSAWGEIAGLLKASHLRNTSLACGCDEYYLASYLLPLES
jgi:hypothetical protein